jgi:hypothetical protein
MVVLMRPTLSIGIVLWLAVAAGAAASPAAEVTGVAPGRSGGLLVAHLATVGLPGDKLLQSMRSGLVSAVELDLALLDEDQQVLGGNQVWLQLGFDLWEEVYAVTSELATHRFRELSDLQDHLGELQGLPVLPADRLLPDTRYRIRVGLRLHAIAPAQRERVEDAIAGSRRPDREGQDRQQASVSLGRLIRLFYKGGDRPADQQETLSDWFSRGELRDETH